MASPRSTPSPRLVPPIIVNDKDRNFLVGLNQYIASELSKIDRDNPEQSYLVHKDAFDKIIEYVTAYKPLLTAIKAEYEDCIDTILRGQREAFYLSGKLKALATEPSTIHNYKKRADDLEKKLNIIADDNDRLKAQVKKLREARIERDIKSAEMEEQPPPKDVRRDQRPIPGLTLEQSTDVKVLAKEQEKLEKQLKDLNISYRTRFSPKDIRDTLKSSLSQKVALRDQLQEQTEILKHKRQKLKVAVEAATAYTKRQPPHQSIGEAVMSALDRAGSQVLDKMPSSLAVEDPAHPTPSAASFDDGADPQQEQEAELLLEYIEKFNELLEDGRYDDAATHAANSPKGILRTPETLQRFKDLSPGPSLPSPLLAFCEALMATVPAYPSRPSDDLSLACVQCALSRNRLDLVTHWLSQDRLTLTDSLADHILAFSARCPQVCGQCLALAQRVYTQTENHAAAVCCMYRQGRVGQAAEYSHKVRLSPSDSASVLAQCPSLPLALGLFEMPEGTAGPRLVPMGRVAHGLISAGHKSLAVEFVMHLHDARKQAHGGPSPLRALVFEDEVTTEAEWHVIVDVLSVGGHVDSSLDVLAAVTVITAVRGASRYVALMEEQRAEERRRKQLETEAAGGGRKRKKKRRNRATAAATERAEPQGEGVRFEPGEGVRFDTAGEEEEEEEE